MWSELSTQLAAVGSVVSTLLCFSALGFASQANYHLSPELLFLSPRLCPSPVIRSRLRAPASQGPPGSIRVTQRRRKRNSGSTRGSLPHPHCLPLHLCRRRGLCEGWSSSRNPQTHKSMRRGSRDRLSRTFCSDR